MPEMELKDANFWRLAWDLDPNSGFVVSSDNISMFDLRVSLYFLSVRMLLTNNRTQILPESILS